MNVELSLDQFCALFDSEEACIKHLIQVRWPHGFICSKCDNRYAYKITTRRLPLFECTSCHHQTSLIAGTVIQGSRTPLRKWMIAIFLLSCNSFGINAVELSQIIKVTYKTAWLILHKIRHAIREEDASVLLSGLVHVNQVNYVRPPRTSYPTYPKDQPLFIGATMNDQGVPTYVKIKQINKRHMIDNYVPRLAKEEFTQEYTNVDYRQIEFVTGRFKSRRFKKLFPIFLEVNRWLTNTFHGIGSRHLGSYLDEFCYRFNLRLGKSSIFNNLTSLCLEHTAISYGQLTL